MVYQLKCKAIALATEAQAFKKQEQREKRLLKKWKDRAQLGRIKAAVYQNRIAGAQEKMSGYDYSGVYSKTLEGIHLHRVKDIRKEARNALLAYGFLRGMPYHRIENFSWTQPNWDRVEKLAIRYSGKSEQEVKQAFAQWLSDARGEVPAKYHDSVVPGSIKSRDYDPAWVDFQFDRELKAWEVSQMKPMTEEELVRGLEHLVSNLT